jgi:hypothetical protein
MKQIAVTLPVILLSFFLNACDSDKDLDNGNQEDQIIRFQIEASGFEVSTASPDTRLNVEGCKFEDGDEIGLFAVKRKKTDSATDNDLKSAEEENFIHNLRLTYNSLKGEWVVDTQVFYPAATDVAYDFYAYYPYQVGMDPTAMIIDGVLDNQEGKSTLGKSDFMTAYKRQHSNQDGAVKLTFNHHFSLVKFELVTTNGGLSPLINVAFNVQDSQIGEFKLIPVALEKEELPYTKKTKDILIGMHQLDNKIYQAIVIPQTITGDAPLFYYSLSGNEGNSGLFYISSKNLITGDNGKLKKGQRYKFSYNYKL